MLALTAGINTFITLMEISVASDEPFIFPTDTIYGIGAPVLSAGANEKIFKIKGRDANMPLPVLAGSWKQVEDLAHLPVNSHHYKWLRSVWGSGEPVTVILQSKIAVPFCTAGGKIAVRLVVYGWLSKAIALTSPVSATSINFSGTPPLTSYDKIVEIFDGKCRFILKGEAGSQPSSIYDLTMDDIKLIRASGGNK